MFLIKEQRENQIKPKMKFSKTLITITLTSVIVFIIGCSKSNTTPPTTGLKIIVQNQSGSIIPSATVSLYVEIPDHEYPPFLFM